MKENTVYMLELLTNYCQIYVRKQIQMRAKYKYKTSEFLRRRYLKLNCKTTAINNSLPEMKQYATK